MRNLPKSSTLSLFNNDVPNIPSNRRNTQLGKIDNLDYTCSSLDGLMSKDVSKEIKKAPPISGNIKVLCRFRPLNDKEKINAKEVICEFESEKVLKIIQREKEDDKREPLLFCFDHIFNLDTLQKDVYEIAARPLVDMVLEGYNGTILAYGQTSSGKTFTMQGVLENPELEGIIPRMINHVFTHVSKSHDDIDYMIKVSIVEIYMEKLKDLLDPERNNLKIKEDKIKGIYIKDLSEHCVINDREILDLIQIGTDNRSVANTNMNANSSRSHLVFQLSIQQINKVDASSKMGKLFLVDLAGSEKMTKTGATGHTLEEGKKINMSLTTLGKVINALTDGKSSHVPYRDSVLTRVLSESLGGNAKTHLIITCSPSIYNESETISTLRFGDRAKKIRNHAKINKEETIPKLKEKVSNYEKIIHKHEITIQSLESIINKYGHSIPKINLDLLDNDSQDEIEEKKFSEEINKMNQEKVQQKIQHGKTQSIDNDLKLLIEFDEKEQLHKELEQTLINLEDKNRELQKENVRIKEEYEKWVFILKQKNYEKKNIIAEEKIKINILEEEIDRITYENEDFLKNIDEKNENIEKLNLSLNTKFKEIESINKLLEERISSLEYFKKLCSEKDLKIDEKENLIKKLNNIIDDKEKIIEENNKLFEIKDKIIQNSVNENNIKINDINSSNSQQPFTNFLNEFLINLNKINEINLNLDLNNLINKYRDKAKFFDMNSSLDIKYEMSSNSSNLEKFQSCEKQIQTEKFIQNQISIIEIELFIPPNEQRNKINEKELVEKHLILMHQMINQKALFQIEKQILENKIKKRQENINDLEIENHKYKEELRLLEEKSFFQQKRKSVNNVVRLITKHSMIDIKIDKINSLYQNVQNNFTRLDFSLFGEQINVQEDDVFHHTTRF